MNDIDVATVELSRFSYFYGRRMLPGNPTLGWLSQNELFSSRRAKWYTDQDSFRVIGTHPFLVERG